MSVLNKIQRLLADDIAAMNHRIEEALHTDNEMLNNVCSNYLTHKGKQIRPILVFLSAKFFGGVSEETVNGAASLEMLHNATLIHDDVIDEATLRRGAETINFVWGNHMAVLVGDFFISNALILGIRSGQPEVIRILGTLGKELSLGEVEQINNAREHVFDYAEYYSMISHKTASLFRDCIKVGAVTSGASESEFAPLMRFGTLLGECFQIKDDILDYVGGAKVGKPTGNDLREGKVTLPLLYAINKADTPRSRQAKELLNRGSLSAEEIQRLIDWAIAEGGIEYSFDCMHRLQAEALALLRSYPASPWRDAFEEISGFILERNF